MKNENLVITKIVSGREYRSFHLGENTSKPIYAPSPNKAIFCHVVNTAYGANYVRIIIVDEKLIKKNRNTLLNKITKITRRQYNMVLKNANMRKNEYISI